VRARLLAAAGAAAVGALLVLLAAGREWGTASVTGAARQHVSVTGRQVTAALPATAVALLALAVAVVAASGVLRRLAAGIGTVVAATAVVAAVRAHADIGKTLAAHAFGVAARSLPTHTNGWWVVALAGGAVATAGFGAVAIAGGRWQGMGARYDAPRSPTRPADPAAGAWEALDRGDDPTA
jgi:hypothetical protein